MARRAALIASSVDADQTRDLRAQCFDIRFTDAAIDNPSPRVNQKTLRQSEDSAEQFAQLRVPNYDWVSNIVLRNKAFDVALIVVNRYADDLQPAVPKVALPAREGRHFLDTWATPGCPKVQQHDPTSKLVESQRPAGQVGAHEIGCDGVQPPSRSRRNTGRHGAYR